MTCDSYINEKSCLAEGILMVRRPDIQLPETRYEEYSIPGRDGKQYIKTTCREDISITIPYNFMTDENNWFQMKRKIQLFFFNAETLSFSDDFDYYYRVKKIILGEAKRTSKRIGNISVTFILDGYEYLKVGAELSVNAGIYINQSCVSHPIYKIIGEGKCKLTVNGNEIDCNVGQSLMIDTHRQESYKLNDSGKVERMNTSINGNYEKMYFIEGENIVSITEGFELLVQPNWRY